MGEPIQKIIPKDEKILKNLFRLLTTKEIQFLSELTDGMPKVSLTFLVEKELKKSNATKPVQKETKEEKAKILPFPKKTSNEKSEVKNVLKSPSIEENDNSLFKKEKIIIEKKIDRVKFLLSQRDKFKKHVHDLKKPEVLHAYHKESKYKVAVKDESEKNIFKTNKGILVNKKCS